MIQIFFSFQKKDKPSEMAQFHPISLYQRLKNFFPERISETQPPFVAGKQITDNIMIAQQMFHALRKKLDG